MQGFKGPGFEANFAEQADAVMRESGEIMADETIDKSKPALVHLAAVDPRTAIQ